MGFSPVDVDALDELLDKFEVEPNRSFLREGFRNGFQLGCEGEEVGAAAAPRNLPSVKKFYAVAGEKINEEIREGRMSGPHAAPPLAELKISPIGIIPKKEPGKFRLIHHLSWPRGGGSVNDSIKQEAAEVKYTSFEVVVEQVRRFGHGCRMWKTDIKSAYRLLKVSRSSHKYLGLRFNNCYYVDLNLPLGAKSACSIFERFGKFLCKCTRAQLGADQFIASYLDDFSSARQRRRAGGGGQAAGSHRWRYSWASATTFGSR
jgi:hypothetical protein